MEGKGDHFWITRFLEATHGNCLRATQPAVGRHGLPIALKVASIRRNSRLGETGVWCLLDPVLALGESRKRKGGG